MPSPDDEPPKTGERRVESTWDDGEAEGAVTTGPRPLTCRSVLVLQRHSGEWVAASFVVAESGLVLSSAAPIRSGPDVFCCVDGP